MRVLLLLKEVKSSKLVGLNMHYIYTCTHNLYTGLQSKVLGVLAETRGFTPIIFSIV